MDGRVLVRKLKKELSGSFVLILDRGLPWWLSSKEPTCNAGDTGVIPGSGRAPEEVTATHSSILAWRIPWTEEPARLQSMESHRDRYTEAT